MITIIAEIGINHNGNMDLATEMIYKAVQCGADVAKFQIYIPERVLDLNSPLILKHWDTIKAAELSFRDVCLLKDECDKAKIKFLASVFHPDRVEWAETIEVEWYKIASRSMYNKELAQAVHATGKPAIISYGYFNGECDALRMLNRGWGNRTHKTLYCVSQYPTPLSAVRLHRFTFAHSLPEAYDGFSDHTMGITASVAAMSLGATIIEKHFTLDRELPGCDQVCSIEPNELYELCRIRDEIDEILY